MKKYYLFLASFFSCMFCMAQNVAINNDASVADNSAILDIKSLSKGVLVPRMSSSERTSIVNPATGLLIYQKDGSTGFYYNAGPSSSPIWLQLNSSIAGGWNLTGNAGTNAATNFMGTTDNQPIIFKHNNKQAAKFDYALLNYFVGNQSGELTNTGRNNVGLGNLALSLNSSGYSNVAIGSNALYWNNNRNNLVAIGDSALFTNGFGATLAGQASYNTAVGSKALYTNTTGSGNTALGYWSLYSNSSGGSNTALGESALYFNSTGSNNTGVGVGALNINTAGWGNSALGTEALLYNNGYNNTGIGTRALRLNSSGYSNVAIGVSALLNNTNRSNLVAIGDSALYNNGLGVLVSYDATFNTAVGSKSLYANTRGNENSALGFETLKANTTGYGNTALGSKALSGNTTGSNNTAVGTLALGYAGNGSDNIGIGVLAIPGGSGSKNIGIGNESMRYNYTGSSNIAIGYEAMRENRDGNHNVAIGGEITLGGANSTIMTGSNNIAIGTGSMYWNTTGSQNTSLGYGANWYNQTGSYNLALGYLSNCGWPNSTTPGTLVNATAIGTYAVVNQNNSMVLGSIEGVAYGTASVNVGIGTITPQARMHIASNSQAGAVNSQLMLEENGDDFTRLTMKNTTNPSKFWDIAAYSNAANLSARLNFYYQGVGDILSLKGDGNATLLGTLTQLSDSRLKKNIVSIDNAIEKLTKLNGYNYYWKDENKDKSLQTGVLAQEVEKVFPELVSKDEKGILSVNYSGIIPVLIQSIKEQQKQIETTQSQRSEQQKQIEKLEKDNLDLKARLEKIEKILVNN